MSLRRLRQDESGTTLTELLVGLSMGTVVMLGLTTMVVLTMQSTARVSTRVDSTQRARLVLTRVIDQLHSACISPKLAPVQQASTSTSLRFVHATGSEVTPVPTLSVITLNEESLTQSDYAWKEGSPPFWTFNETKPTSTTTLMTKVKPIPGKPVFAYYGYSLGALNETAFLSPLSETDALHTIGVSVAFMTSPAKNTAGSETDPARIQDSVSFRLSSPSYNPTAPSLPCQ
jgi:hypothetical protein